VKARTPGGPSWAGSYQSELRVCLLSGYAKTIAEWIAAKSDRRSSSTFEFLLAFRASVQRVGQNTLEIVDMEIDVNRRPVPLISSNVVRPLRGFGSCSFLDQADLGAATFENDVCRYRSSGFDKTQCIAIKSQPFIELRDVNRNRVIHVLTLPELAVESFFPADAPTADLLRGGR
jgi:hypothetical protein